MTTHEQREQQFRYQERERLINDDEFNTGHYTSENYCARMQKHINKMEKLQGEHLKDIAYYKTQMQTNGCKTQMQTNGCNTSGGSRRRRAGKHSKKSRRHSKKSRRH